MAKPLKKQQKVSTQLKTNLIKNFDKYEYDGIQNAIQINGKTTKKVLQQCKFKKYNYFNP